MPCMISPFVFLTVSCSQFPLAELTQVALEIVDHPEFCDLDLSTKDRGGLLKTLAVSGFATAFEQLVQHERVGRVEGVLDAGHDQ